MTAASIPMESIVEIARVTDNELRKMGDTSSLSRIDALVQTIFLVACVGGETGELNVDDSLTTADLVQKVRALLLDQPIDE